MRSFRISTPVTRRGIPSRMSILPGSSLRYHNLTRFLSTKLPQQNKSSEPTPSTAPVPIMYVAPPQMLTPHETMDKIVEVSDTRADRPIPQMTVSAALGGAYLSLGCCFYVMVAGGSLALQASVPGIHALVTALIFPTGLSLILLTGQLNKRISFNLLLLELFVNVPCFMYHLLYLNV